MCVCFLFRFFLQEIQAGEALISSGDIEQGVTHLANAVVVCGQPTQLLQVSYPIWHSNPCEPTWNYKYIDLIKLFVWLVLSRNVGASADIAITSVHTAHPTDERIWQ